MTGGWQLFIRFLRKDMFGSVRNGFPVEERYIIATIVVTISVLNLFKYIALPKCSKKHLGFFLEKQACFFSFFFLVFFLKTDYNENKKSMGGFL